MSFILIIRDNGKIYRGGQPIFIKEYGKPERIEIDFCADDAPMYFRVPWQYLSRKFAELHRELWEKQHPEFKNRVEII